MSVAKAAELGGVFSLCRLDRYQDRFEVINTLTRTRPLVYTQTSDAAYVGSRIILTACAAAAPRSPTYNLEGMVSYLLNSYFVLDQTPFAGVYVAPIDSAIRLMNGSVHLEKMKSYSGELSRGIHKPLSSDWDSLAELLATSVGQFAADGHIHQLWLSGGRDSRLLGAALWNQGVGFVATVQGDDRSADMLVGRRVIEALGIEPQFLTRIVDEKDGGTRIDVRKDMSRDLHKMDGMHINLPVGPSSILTTGFTGEFTGFTFSGVGGECLRGGYAIPGRSHAQGEVGLSLERVREIVDGFLSSPYEHVVNPDYRRLYQRRYGEWLKHHLDPEIPEAVLELAYIHHAEGMKNAFVDTTDILQPLCDNLFIRQVHELRLSERLKELVHFELIRRLAPPLERVPLEGSRWAFEAHGPRRNDVEGYRSRAPILGSGHTTNYPYYQVGTDMRDEFESGILGGPDILFELVQRDVLEKVFRTREIYHYSMSWALWHIYAISMMLSGEWLRSLPSLPSGTVLVRYGVAWPDLVRGLLDHLNYSCEGFEQSLKLAEYQGRPDELVAKGPGLLDAALRRMVAELIVALSSLRAQYSIADSQWREFLSTLKLKSPPRASVGDTIITTIWDMWSELTHAGGLDEARLADLELPVGSEAKFASAVTDGIRLSLFVTEGEAALEVGPLGLSLPE